MRLTLFLFVLGLLATLLLLGLNLFQGRLDAFPRGDDAEAEEEQP